MPMMHRQKEGREQNPRPSTKEEALKCRNATRIAVIFINQNSRLR
jgi:hypothetical protein